MCEIFVLRQKAVAGMDRLRAGGARGFDDALDAQVAVRGGRAADVHGFVACGHMFRVRVRVGIDGDARDPETFARRGNAARDFAAVGDQNLVEHGFGVVRKEGHARCAVIHATTACAFEEGRNPFARFRAGAGARDPVGGLLDQRRVERPAGHIGDEPLARLHRVGAVRDERRGQLRDGFVERIGRHRVVNETERRRARAVEHLGRRE